MGATEQTIVEQFAYWRKAIALLAPLQDADITVWVGCGTSYNLALSLAALANAAGRRSIAVPGGEWANRPRSYWPAGAKVHVVALSRSGETTETLAAARASRAAGMFVTGITMEPDSALPKNVDRAVLAETHKVEGIVMTSSASLLLLLGLLLLGYKVPASLPDAAEKLMQAVNVRVPPLLAGRSHFVYLGGGHLYGVGLEGALKLMEMSQTFTQGFHPLEYRHGPISLIDEHSVAVMLYSADQHAAEAKLARELQDKGALVIGLGGPGDVSMAVDCDAAFTGLACLPALQILGERVAQARNIDTLAPRHLTKVVMLA
jgi:glucosamine--fructose-6-phosphate aminotransferase (isomerizing)